MAPVSATFVFSSPAFAHPGRELEPGQFWAAWTADPWVLLGIGLPSLLYARGVNRVWGRAGPGRGVSRWQFRSFCAGVAALMLALVTPLHALGGALFSGHMVQHQVLMLAAAPLLVAGAPNVAFAWALPRRWVQGAAGAIRRQPLMLAWRTLSHPAGAGAVFALALWGWHVPGPYQATLESDLAHAAQHASFLAAAVLFWWVVARGWRVRERAGTALLLVFATMIHGNALGALLTFSAVAWYPAYAESAARWGVSALEDQQLGGLVMWVPSGLVYLLAALALVTAALRGSAASRRLPLDSEPGRPVAKHAACMPPS